MKNRLLFVLVLLALPLMAISPLAEGVRSMLGRTGNELSLFLLLNGERARSATLQADGGGLVLYTADAGIASATVTGGEVIFIECPTTAAHICTPRADGTWDGGCSSTLGDPNYGSQIAVGGYRWISLQNATTTVKAVPASGQISVLCPVSYAR